MVECHWIGSGETMRSFRGWTGWGSFPGWALLVAATLPVSSLPVSYTLTCTMGAPVPASGIDLVIETLHSH